jgi:hypothetical protein
MQRNHAIHKGAAAMLNPTSSMRQLHSEVKQTGLTTPPVLDTFERKHICMLTLCSFLHTALCTLPTVVDTGLLTDQ